jgi:hypothetical protein
LERLPRDKAPAGPHSNPRSERTGQNQDPSFRSRAWTLELDRICLLRDFQASPPPRGKLRFRQNGGHQKRKQESANGLRLVA